MKLICGLLFLVLSFSAQAFVLENGTIDDVIIEGAFVSIWLSGENDLSECSGGARWIIQEGEDNYQAKLSAILMAAASNKSIKLRSTGVCGNWSANKIYYIHLDN